MSFFEGLEQFGSIVTNNIGSAFDANKHGFLSGNYDDFQLGLDKIIGSTTKVAGVPFTILENNLTKLGSGIGQGANNILSPLSQNPSFFLISGIAILGLLIVGYGMIKVGKYI